MNKEIEELLNTFKELINAYSPDTEPFTIDYDYEIKYSALESLLSHIEQLKQKAELADHYKHLYSKVKKQKDDVVEDIKKQITFCTNEAEGTVNNDKCWMAVNYLKKLLRMLGEINDL